MDNWDSYFMSICDTISTNVKCPSRQIGVVLVRDKHIVSTGYNGPPSGFPHPGSVEFNVPASNLHRAGCLVFPRDFDGCPRRVLNVPSGERLSLCPCAHAERNAIDSAAKMGHATAGCTLYLNTCMPCLDCSYSIVNSGIVEVVVRELEEYKQEGFTGKMILEECGVKIRQGDK